MASADNRTPSIGVQDAFGIAVSAVEDGVVTLTIHGEVDMLTAPQVAETIEHAQSQGVALVDMSGVAFLGSAGLSVLVEGSRRADDAGQRFAIVAGNHVVARAIEVTGLNNVLHVFPGVDDARTYLCE